MDCKAFKELVPAFVLDALDESERAACAGHLDVCGPHAGCAQAEADARALAAQLAGALPARTVDPRVWSAIESRAQTELAARRTDGEGQPPPRRREPAGWGVAIIALGLLAAASEPPSPSARALQLACRRMAAANVSAYLAR